MVPAAVVAVAGAAVTTPVVIERGIEVSNPHRNRISTTIQPTREHRSLRMLLRSFNSRPASPSPALRAMRVSKTATMGELVARGHSAASRREDQ